METVKTYKTKFFSTDKKMFKMINETEYKHLQSYRKTLLKGLTYKALTAEEITLLDFIKKEDVSGSLMTIQQLIGNPGIKLGTAGRWGKFIQNKLITLIEEVNEKFKSL